MKGFFNFFTVRYIMEDSYSILWFSGFFVANNDGTIAQPFFLSVRGDNSNVRFILGKFAIVDSFDISKSV